MIAIWSGTTSSATTVMNMTSRPRKCIHEKAYAANAAIVIGITVEGIVTARLLRNALPKPSFNASR